MQVSTSPSGELLIEERETDVDRALQLAREVSQDELDQRLATLQQATPLLSVEKLRVQFPVRGAFGQTRRYFVAVKDVSFDVYPGETLGLVGESGCGKSTLARAILQLIKPASGTVRFENQEVTALLPNEMRRLRREMQIIFQNPFGSLDSRMTVGKAVMEPMLIHAKPRERSGTAETRRSICWNEWA